MNGATATQLRIIGELAAALEAEGIRWWLFGGWALDFHAGAVLRDHSDIEFYVWKQDAARAVEALRRAGFLAPPGLHPNEGQPFLKDGQEAGMWYLVRDDADRVVTPGRWADWPWIAGAFDGPPAMIGGQTAPVVTLEALLDTKENFSSHPHGAPLREKDVADIARLREMISAAERNVGPDPRPR
jgi:hypothetical protein